MHDPPAYRVLLPTLSYLADCLETGCIDMCMYEPATFGSLHAKIMSHRNPMPSPPPQDKFGSCMELAGKDFLSRVPKLKADLIAAMKRA